MKITAKRLRHVLRYNKNTGIFHWKKTLSKRAPAGSIAGTPNKNSITIKVDGKLYRAHRLAWLYIYGKWPKKKLDHKDLDGTHNWIKNLREVTDSQNSMNKSVSMKNKIGLKGVCFDPRYKKPFKAQIQVNGKQRCIGHFDSPKMAHAAYAKASKIYHGEFGRTK